MRILAIAVLALLLLLEFSSYCMDAALGYRHTVDKPRNLDTVIQRLRSSARTFPELYLWTLAGRWVDLSRIVKTVFLGRSSLYIHAYASCVDRWVELPIKVYDRTLRMQHGVVMYVGSGRVSRNTTFLVKLPSCVPTYPRFSKDARLPYALQGAEAVVVELKMRLGDREPRISTILGIGSRSWLFSSIYIVLAYNEKIPNHYVYETMFGSTSHTVSYGYQLFGVENFVRALITKLGHRYIDWDLVDRYANSVVKTMIARIVSIKQTPMYVDIEPPNVLDYVPPYETWCRTITINGTESHTWIPALNASIVTTLPPDEGGDPNSYTLALGIVVRVYPIKREHSIETTLRVPMPGPAEERICMVGIGVETNWFEHTNYYILPDSGAVYNVLIPFYDFWWLSEGFKAVLKNGDKVTIKAMLSKACVGTWNVSINHLYVLQHEEDLNNLKVETFKVLDQVNAIHLELSGTNPSRDLVIPIPFEGLRGYVLNNVDIELRKLTLELDIATNPRIESSKTEIRTKHRYLYEECATARFTLCLAYRCVEKSIGLKPWIGIHRINLSLDIDEWFAKDLLWLMTTSIPYIVLTLHINVTEKSRHYYFGLEEQSFDPWIYLSVLIIVRTHPEIKYFVKPLYYPMLGSVPVATSAYATNTIVYDRAIATKASLRGSTKVSQIVMNYALRGLDNVEITLAVHDRTDWLGDPGSDMTIRVSGNFRFIHLGFEWERQEKTPYEPEWFMCRLKRIEIDLSEFKPYAITSVGASVAGVGSIVPPSEDWISWWLGVLSVITGAIAIAASPEWMPKCFGISSLGLGAVSCIWSIASKHETVNAWYKGSTVYVSIPPNIKYRQYGRVYLVPFDVVISIIVGPVGKTEIPVYVWIEYVCGNTTYSVASVVEVRYLGYLG